MEQSGILQTVPLDDIRPNPYQPRRRLDEDSLEELAASIRTHGVLQPVVVRPRDEGYELIAGERRWRAARLAGLVEIPALVRDASDRQVAMLALLENLQRDDLHFFEEAEGYARLLSEFEMTQEELARQLGRSQGAVANRLRLLRLPEAVRDVISREMLSERHARALLAVADETTQLELAKRSAREGWTVRQLEARIERLGRRAPRQRRTAVVRDARIFLNEFRKAAAAVRQQGFAVQMRESLGEDAIVLEVTIRLRPGERRVAAGGRSVEGRGGGA